MNWTELLKSEIESTYKTTNRLINVLDADGLDWKPSTGNNWMTTGQLLKHISNACGFCVKGFVTGDWGFPPDFDVSKLPPEEMLPPAEKMPAVSSVDEARQLLADDKKTALEMLAQCSEEDLSAKLAAAPWAPALKKVLGLYLLEMVAHLAQHNHQLFYYLKLQGKPVNTIHLYGGM